MPLEAHWLSWKCGLSLAAAREHVRVGRAQADLPRVRAAFAAGQLSYSKARAITRLVMLPDMEADLVELARTATAAQLDRIAAGYVRAGRLADPEVAAHNASATPSTSVVASTRTPPGAHATPNRARSDPTRNGHAPAGTDAARGARHPEDEHRKTGKHDNQDQRRPPDRRRKHARSCGTRVTDVTGTARREDFGRIAGYPRRPGRASAAT